jgi:hypothetical protein
MKGSAVTWAFEIKHDLPLMRNNHIMREYLDVELWWKRAGSQGHHRNFGRNWRYSVGPEILSG